jgi:hypothetical protein
MSKRAKRFKANEEMPVLAEEDQPEIIPIDRPVTISTLQNAFEL